MNGAQIHLALNHFPVVLSVVSLAFLVSGLIGRGEEIRRIGLVLLVLSAVSSVPAFLSGEPAEEVIEDLPGVSESVIHEHEESAQWAFGLTIAAGLGALGVLVAPRFKRKLPAAVGYGVLALNVISALAMARTAHLGGLVRHDEIAPGEAERLEQTHDHSEHEH